MALRNAIFKIILWQGISAREGVGRNIVQVAGIGQSIQQKDFGVRVALINIIDEITANKTRAAGDQ